MEIYLPKTRKLPRDFWNTIILQINLYHFNTNLLNDFLNELSSNFLIRVQPTFPKFCTLSKIRHEKSQRPIREGIWLML